MNAQKNRRILLVEDSPSLGRVYTDYLSSGPYDVMTVEYGKDALAALDSFVPDAVLLDLRLPDMDGMEILKHITEQGIPAAVIVITAHGSINLSVEAMRLGAHDFLVKPFNADRLLVTLHNALDRLRLTRIVESFKEDAGQAQFQGFIGASLPMQAVYRIIKSAAPSTATVMITGESGTGKELCAEAVHALSPRVDKPFIAINCAAIPRDLMESEIFGHVKGAFTGATSDRQGAASRADGGTLFLDEICEMGLDLQTKLLRFIQTGSFVKVGGARTEQVDVRFVCATNVDPLEQVRAGKFRQDLYYRLHVIPILMPPLRDRDDDVLIIAQEFLTRFANEESKHFTAFAPETEVLLEGYSWPGNVRELENVIRNVVVLNDGELVTSEMLPPAFQNLGVVTPCGPHKQARPGLAEAETPSAAPVIRPLWLVEKDAIESAIATCDGNIPKAAAMLGISASTIYRKRQSWEQAG
jgi:DNA-binding NtrC family response regulator